MAKDESKALVVTGLIEKFLGFVRNWMNENFYDWSARWSNRIAYYGLLVAAGIGFIACLAVAIQQNSLSFFLAGVGWGIFLLIVQYVAYRFSEAARALMETSPTRIRSSAFLDCFALLSIIGGLIVLVVSVIVAVREQNPWQFAIGLGIFFVCEYLAIIALHPDIVNLEVSENIGAGEDAIGIVTFLMKGLLSLVPIIFLYGVVVGIAGGVTGFCIILTSTGFAAMGGFLICQASAGLIAASGTLPFTSYIVFVLYYLMIDVLRSVLVIPAKLDALASPGESSRAE